MKFNEHMSVYSYITIYYIVIGRYSLHDTALQRSILVPKLQIRPVIISILYFDHFTK